LLEQALDQAAGARLRIRSDVQLDAGRQLQAPPAQISLARRPRLSERWQSGVESGGARWRHGTRIGRRTQRRR
jgi:hypothetical protein